MLKPNQLSHIKKVISKSETWKDATEKLGYSRTWVGILAKRLHVRPKRKMKERHDILMEIIPELLVSRRMRAGEIIEAVHDTYGSIAWRLMYLYIAKLRDAGVIVREGKPGTIESTYRLSALGRQVHLRARSGEDARTSSPESYQH